MISAHGEYHKGETCKYLMILCQEGYCSDCEIYWIHLRRMEQLLKGVKINGI